VGSDTPQSNPDESEVHMDREVLESVQSELDSYLGEFHDCFRSQPSRTHMGTYVKGQLGPLQRKSVEPIALKAGLPPRTLQQFLGAHRWDEAAMGTRVREIVARDHAHEIAIGVIDETSFSKKGGKTVGVQRQWCGETGKVDNCVQTVHLSYVGDKFATPIDGDLYLPQSWVQDPERCAEAGVPTSVAFRTKLQIALDLVDRSRRDGIELSWITTDEFYGRAPVFREGLSERGLRFVLEVPVDIMGWTPRGLARKRQHRRVDEMFKRGGPSWINYHVKDSTKGPVVWQVRATRFIPHAGTEVCELWLLIAHNPLTGELKYFLSNAPEDTPIETMLAVAFARWNVERNFQDSKQEIGFNDFEVRTYTALQRHLALSMVSHLFLVRAARVLQDKMTTRWSLRQARELANTLVDQTLTPEQRERDLEYVLRKNRYYDQRAKVAERAHAKRRERELREAGLDLQAMKRCRSGELAL